MVANATLLTSRRGPDSEQRPVGEVDPRSVVFHALLICSARHPKLRRQAAGVEASDEVRRGHGSSWRSLEAEGSAMGPIRSVRVGREVGRGDYSCLYTTASRSCAGRGCGPQHEGKARHETPSLASNNPCVVPYYGTR